MTFQFAERNLAGGGTSHHFAGELSKLQTQMFITHIPYRWAGPALQDGTASTWASKGAALGKLTPPQFASFVSSEVKRWVAVVKASGAKLD